MAKMQIIEINCDNCNKQFNKRLYIDVSKNPKNKYCSKECKKLHNRVEWTEERKKEYSQKVSGKNNPNFNNKWSDKQKEHLSKVRKELFEDNPELRFETGKANRGKKFSEELISKMHDHRSFESYQKVHSEETKQLIGLKSKLKFTEVYNNKMRKVMEDKGLWLPMTLENSFHFYNKESYWIQKMWDLVELPADFNIIGIFNTKTNQIGYVRDHRLSRKEGYFLKIYPELLRHPCNCSIILHSENSSKRSKSTLSKDQLFKNIEEYSLNNWPEHILCLELINKYKNNILWELPHE